MDLEAKKKVLRMIPYGMFVIGVKNNDEVNAYTADWVTQSSFTPPLVVICSKKGTISNEMIRASKVFSVSVLEAGQKEMAAHFVKPMRNVGNKFGDVEYDVEKTGCPILRDSLGFFECDVKEINDIGDHSIVIGEVINAGIHRDGEPLLLRSTGWHYGG